MPRLTKRLSKPLLMTLTLALASCAGMKPNPDGSHIPVRYWPFIIE